MQLPVVAMLMVSCSNHQGSSWLLARAGCIQSWNGSPDHSSIDGLCCLYIDTRFNTTRFETWRRLKLIELIVVYHLIEHGYMTSWTQHWSMSMYDQWSGQCNNHTPIAWWSPMPITCVVSLCFSDAMVDICHYYWHISFFRWYALEQYSYGGSTTTGGPSIRNTR